MGGIGQILDPIQFGGGRDGEDEHALDDRMGRDHGCRRHRRAEPRYRARTEDGIGGRMYLPFAEGGRSIAGIFHQHLDGDELVARDRAGGRSASGLVGDTEDGDTLRLDHARIACSEGHAEIDVRIGRWCGRWRGRGRWDWGCGWRPGGVGRGRGRLRGWRWATVGGKCDTRGGWGCCRCAEARADPDHRGEDRRICEKDDAKDLLPGRTPPSPCGGNATRGRARLIL